MIMGKSRGSDYIFCKCQNLIAKWILIKLVGMHMVWLNAFLVMRTKTTLGYVLGDNFFYFVLNEKNCLVCVCVWERDGEVTLNC